MTEDVASGPPRGALEADVPTLVPATTDRSVPGPHRRLLGRDQILREAVRLIDEEGRDRLTMRRLGSELGVEAMALYRYIPGREQLLDGVVEYVMNELYQKTMMPGPARLLAGVPAADGPRRTRHRRRPSPGVPAGRNPAAGRPAGCARHCAASAGSRGSCRRCSASASPTLRASASTGRSRPSCSVTCCWSPPRWTWGRRTELDDDIEFFETNDLSQYPRLMALQDQLRSDGHGTEFEDALEDLLDRIELVFD